ncbi:MAG: 50S ribosomal protein L25 [Candidatus Rokubacteria bacterium]|nr:50S ribosomal protein L25 [Candidatus Rokubacteria bacterium]
MELREITIERREGTGKQVAKRLRRRGLIPAVLYGRRASASVAVNPTDILKVTHGHGGSTQLLTLRFAEDGETRTAIIRDLQIDPVTDGLLHVDLQEVAMDQAITVTVAVHPVGEPAGVKEQSGILAMILREVQVSCLPGQIPERIDADVSALRIGDVLTVAMLTPPPGVRILNDPNQAVATVAPPMAEEVPAAAPVAPTEPEVVTERKPKPEEETK